MNGMLSWSSRIACLVMVLAGPATPCPGGGFEAGRTFRDCEVCPVMVVVPAGSFRMGSDVTEAGRRDDEGPVRAVSFERPFAIGTREVTFAEWTACVDAGGCDGYARQGPADRPVNYVSWQDARRYAKWLSRDTGQTYRLPSEAEWEYAARGGTQTRYWCGDDEQCLDEVAWHPRNSGGNTRPVGQLAPNPFGLYDVYGNLAEWVADCYRPGSGAASGAQPEEDADCAGRVLRGGAWGSNSNDMRSAARAWLSGNIQYYAYGFRVAREIGGE